MKILGCQSAKKRTERGKREMGMLFLLMEKCCFSNEVSSLMYVERWIGQNGKERRIKWNLFEVMWVEGKEGYGGS